MRSKHGIIVTQQDNTPVLDTSGNILLFDTIDQARWIMKHNGYDDRTLRFVCAYRVEPRQVRQYNQMVRERNG